MWDWGLKSLHFHGVTEFLNYGFVFDGAFGNIGIKTVTVAARAASGPGAESWVSKLFLHSASIPHSPDTFFVKHLLTLLSFFEGCAFQ